jgi:hypothetical protein
VLSLCCWLCCCKISTCFVSSKESPRDRNYLVLDTNSGTSRGGGDKRGKPRVGAVRKWKELTTIY